MIKKLLLGLTFFVLILQSVSSRAETKMVAQDVDNNTQRISCPASWDFPDMKEVSFNRYDVYEGVKNELKSSTLKPVTFIDLTKPVYLRSSGTYGVVDREIYYWSVDTMLKPKRASLPIIYRALL